MGFSSALQGRAAHEALIVRQDAELRLMETMKRSIQMKAKCDKEYAISLASVAQQGLKIDRADDLQDSLITKSWRIFMDELDHQAKQFKINAELLEVVCEKISHLSQDKRKARKVYQEEHAKIAARLNHLTDEVIRKKAEYQKHLEGYKTLRTRFEEHYIKSGRSGRKLDDVRDKYQKACRKLHLTHNEYVLTIIEAIEVEKDFRTILLPGLLEHQQSAQESFILLWKNILQEAVQHSDLTSDKFKEIQKRIELAMNSINPYEEYREFTEKHKTSPASPISFQFDESLIEDIPGKLQANTLTVDNLTVDWLRSRLNEIETSIKECQEKQEKLISDLNLNGGTGTQLLTNGINGLSGGNDTQKQSKDLNSLRCQEKQKQKLAELIKIALSEVGCEELPSGCDDHLTNVEQNFIENNGCNNEQQENSVIPANSNNNAVVSAMLQKGAEMMSIIKSPFKRKFTPQSPTPKAKPRIRSSSEGGDNNRSQSLGNISVNNSCSNISSSLSVVAIDINNTTEENSHNNPDVHIIEINKNSKSNETETEPNQNAEKILNSHHDSQMTNVYAELDLASLDSKNRKDNDNEMNVSLHQTKSDCTVNKVSDDYLIESSDNIQNPSQSKTILQKSENNSANVENHSAVVDQNLPPKCESFLYGNKNSPKRNVRPSLSAMTKNSIDAHLDRIDEINKSLDDKLMQTLPIIKDQKLEKRLEIVDGKEDEILECSGDVDGISSSCDNVCEPIATIISSQQLTNKNPMIKMIGGTTQIPENVTDFELQQLIQTNFIKPTKKQIQQEQKEVEMLAKQLRKKTEDKSKKNRSSSFSHKSINNLIINLKGFSFTSRNNSSHHTSNVQLTTQQDPSVKSADKQQQQNLNEIDADIADAIEMNEKQKFENKKLKHSSSERIAIVFGNLMNERQKLSSSDNNSKDKNDKNNRLWKRRTSPKKSPKSPKTRKTKSMRNTFRAKVFRFQTSKKSPKICKKCSKKKQEQNEKHNNEIIDSSSKNQLEDIENESNTDQHQQRQQQQQKNKLNEFCVCDVINNEFDSSTTSNDDPLCIKEHTYCEPFGMSFSPNRPLYEEEWFHGVLPREEVVRLLKTDGDFLVRETMRNEESQIVLSVCWNGHKHFIVQTTTEGHFRFEGPPFPSIQELIMHQYQSELPVTVKSGAILRRPIMRERWELSNDDVILLEKIGRGNFGDVYKAKLKSTKLDVAVKTCRMTLPEEQKRKFLQEGRILKQYDHPNIVKLIGICVQKQPIMIVMELVPGGSLLNYLRKNSNTLTTKQLMGMCKDAAAGMRYLESKNCIHRDLAARNCLIDYENSVKISDFGMSREEEEYIVSDGMKQIPVKWTAPEALNFGKYTSLCDVWSYGILMWEIFSKGDTPYSGMSNSRARERIDNGYRMPAPENTPPEMYRLMLKCWAAEPESRPHFDEIYNVVDTLILRQDS